MIIELGISIIMKYKTKQPIQPIVCKLIQTVFESGNDQSQQIYISEPPLTQIHSSLKFQLFIFADSLYMKTLQYLQQMNKLLSFADIHPIKKLLASLRIITKDRYQHHSILDKIANTQSLHDLEYSNTYNDNLSYCYKLFDCSNPSSLHLFHPYSDREIGGDSQCQMFYNYGEKCLELTGQIDAKNKDKLEKHPSIGIARRHPYRLRCGPFQALQIEIYSDGMPMHVGVELQSDIEGVVKCYGILTSRIKGWGHYELPLQNMLVVGAEDGDRGSKDYRLPKESQQFFDRSAYDAYRILKTQAKEPIIRDINFRLLDSKSVQRKLGLRNIYLVRRSHSKKFLEEYRQPFFYKVQGDPYIVNEEVGVSWLTKGYRQFSEISLGDRVYKRKGGQHH